MKKEKLKEEPYLIFDTEINAKKEVPDIGNVHEFTAWLNQAHTVCHQWLMAMIEGKLFNEFSKREVKMVNIQPSGLTSYDEPVVPSETFSQSGLTSYQPLHHVKGIVL